MLKFYHRLDSRCAIVLFCCLLALIGCSSRTVLSDPPIHSTLPESNRGNVKVDPATIKYRILLIGDAGQPEDDEPVLETLGEWAKRVPKRTSIVFLGDNMYPKGLTKEAEKEGEADKRLGPQLDVVIESQASGLFIPGNHDWENGGKSGLSTIIAQEDFINRKLGAQAGGQHPAFLPECGKPGPRMLELPTTAPVVRLVVLDTQWWLHEHQKPYKDPKAVIVELKTQLMTELPVIVVGHHPIETYGPHGVVGREWWKSVGCSLLRWLKWDVCNQDVDGEDYKYMISQLNEAFSVSGKTSLLIYAAGHEHSLQVLKGRTANYLLVSGAGSSDKVGKKSEVEKRANTLFAHQHTGFMVVDFLEDDLKGDTVLLRVVEDGGEEVLLNYPLNYPLE